MFVTSRHAKPEQNPLNTNVIKPFFNNRFSTKFSGLVFVGGAAVAEPSVSLCSTVETLSFHGALLLSLPEQAGPRGGEQVTVMLSEGHEDTETVSHREGWRR